MNNILGRTPTDTELWEGIKLGDQKCFDILFDRYWASLYAGAYNYLRDAALSEEIVHDVFINIWQKRNSLQIIAIKNYLKCATRYHAYKCIKDRKASAIMYVENYNDELIIQQRNEGEERLATHDIESSIQEHLLQLPKRCREIFLLSRLWQLSNDEIAAHFGISKRTVENQLTHALKFLRAHFKKTAILLFLFLLR